jgi:uncharacterized repeat protein (TIGR01451 family)
MEELGRRRIAAGVGLSLGAALGLGATAQAADFTVTNLSDGVAPGPAGSLRKAVSDANANPGADTILFDGSLTGSVALASSSIQITGALDVQGPGPEVLGIDAYDGTGRIFTIDPVVQGDQVTISGLSMAYGHPAGSGGAIYNVDSKLTVSDSTLFFNSSGSLATGIAGGAIADKGGFDGGSETRIESSTITGNSATAGSGGGLGSAGELGTIVDSTISNNYAYADGGGFFSNVNGGTFQSSTVGRNYAYADGGGLATGGGGPHIAFHNSIVGNNSAAGSGPDLFGADPFDADFSLVEGMAGVSINTTVTGSNLLGADPRLPYYAADNGGSTPTMLPFSNSPVIDQGKAATGATTDQRGLPRPFDVPALANSVATGADASDMGAVETTLHEATPVDISLTMTDAPDPVTAGSPMAFTLRATNNGPNPGTNVVIAALLPNGLTVNAAGTSAGCAAAPYGALTAVSCPVGGLISGGSQSRTISATPTTALVGSPYVVSYGRAVASEADPNPYNNGAYQYTTVVAPNPPPNPPVVKPAGPLAAALKKCRKKFRGKKKAKKRAKCIKKARATLVSRAFEPRDTGQPLHSWNSRKRPPALRRMPRSSYPDLPGS